MVQLSEFSCSLSAPATHSYALDVCIDGTIIKSCSNGVGDAQVYDNNDCSGSYREVTVDGTTCSYNDPYYTTSMCS